MNPILPKVFQYSRIQTSSEMSKYFNYRYFLFKLNDLFIKSYYLTLMITYYHYYLELYSEIATINLYLYKF
jgi:hypothetical protein